MTRDEFHNWLRDWLKNRIAALDGDEERIEIHQRLDGALGSNGHNRKLLVSSPSGTRYYLDGATTLAGVTEYLFRLQKNPELAWERGEETPSGWRVSGGL